MHTKEQTTEKKSNMRRQDGTVEDVRYYGAIPDGVVNEMTSEIVEQYYLWDEVVKKEIERHPRLMLPLIREVFHKIYPEDVEIRSIATEYVVRRIHKEDGSTLNSIFADIAVQVGRRDIYHMECQMNREKGMVLRMLEYDIHIGLRYGTDDRGKQAGADIRYELVLPRSVILYLDSVADRPPEESCLLRFADGTTHTYRIPVMHVQEYTAEMVREKHLNMLIPFLPVRYRKYLNLNKDGVRQPVPEAVRKDLTEMVRKCIMIIEREKENGTLTDDTGKDVMELLGVTCGYLLKNEPELKEEVNRIMRPLIVLQSEKMEEEIRQITEKKERAEAEKRRAEAEKQRIEAEHQRIVTEKETAIRRLIKRYRASGQSRQEVKENIQDIFSMDEAEAEKKVERYWEQKSE